MKNATEVAGYLTRTAPFSRYFGNHYLPSPFCEDPNLVRTIVLGTDPTDPRHPNQHLPVVFGLDKGDSPYFRSIGKNLEVLGVSIVETYVQNLCRNYFIVETSKNPVWRDAASLWLPVIKDELDRQFDQNIPILATAGVIMDVANRGVYYKAYDHFYQRPTYLMSADNAFGRPLVAFYRHWKYNLERWPDYARFLRRVFFP